MATGRAVLLVEDDPAIRELVRQALEDEGRRVEAVGDGRGAVDLIRAACPALVVLDVLLPHLDGVGVAQALRARCGEAVPVILISASSIHLDWAVRRVGPAVALAKPFDLGELLAAVARLLPAD